MTKYEFSIEHDASKGPFPIDCLEDFKYLAVKLGKIQENGKQEINFSIDPDVVERVNLMSLCYNLGAYVEGIILAEEMKKANQKIIGSIH